MKRTGLLLVAVAFLGSAIFFALGCIVSDGLTTIMMNPDGSAEWVRFQSNIRSTEKGAKGAEELKKFVDDFNSRKDSDLARIAAAGGEIVEARWIRNIEPYSTLVTARFPTASTVEAFFTIKGEKDEVIARPRFTRNGTRRRMAIAIPLPKDEQAKADKSAEKVPPTLRELREQQANGISETRFVVANGHIVASQGFAVADDARSCLIDPTRIEELVRAKPENVELFVEWEVAAK